MILASVIIIFGGIYFYQSNQGNNLLQSPKFNSSKEPESKDYSNPLGFQFKYSNLAVKEDTEE